MEESELYEAHWLLSYEANVKGWLPSKNGGDHVLASGAFADLKNVGISFYDPQRLDTMIPSRASASVGEYALFDAVEDRSSSTGV